MEEAKSAQAAGAGRKTIAVMQPYFFPYAGYFRLFSQVDEFVILDCVQFPRRGRVHRTELPGTGSDPDWLTLPLARQSREVLIRDLAFANDARKQFDRRLARVPGLRSSNSEEAQRILDYLHQPLHGVVDYLEAGLQLVTQVLGISKPVRRSSSLELPASLRGQDRMLAITKALGASVYLNSPGGRSLYSAGHFSDAGVELQFLPDYQGRHFHLLPDLLGGQSELIAEELRTLAHHDCSGGSAR